MKTYILYYNPAGYFITPITAVVRAENEEVATDMFLKELRRNFPSRKIYKKNIQIDNFSQLTERQIFLFFS